ncbi:hypothetical protein V5N11_001511 [Cardamine amara subsp. amara]|uniref:Gag-pol polyprotein n=1 Tax=Cardamine amara subsp. amara TaxID=228776 RepID=A0ABD0Z488_CARAN
MADQVKETLHNLNHLFVEAFAAKVDQMINKDDKSIRSEHLPDPISKIEARPRRELIISRRALGIQSKTEERSENLFYMQYHVNGKLCSLVVDGGSCINIASETMVQNLGLEVNDHPKPYNIHWLNESGEMKVK